MKPKKKTYERKLTHTDISQYNEAELFKFTFSRKSFYRDYKLLHNTEEERVKEKVGLVLSYVDLSNLAREIRLCFQAACMNPSRNTYMFNLYVIELLELHYSNESFSSKKIEIEENEHLSYYPSPTISYDWVLFSKLLTPYQRYLLFEYLVLGYNFEDLGKRRYCTKRTISNHFNAIIKELNQEDESQQLSGSIEEPED